MQNYSVPHKKKHERNVYSRLVLAGGGLRGLAYIGAISALRKLNILDEIKKL